MHADWSRKSVFVPHLEKRRDFCARKEIIAIFAAENRYLQKKTYENKDTIQLLGKRDAPFPHDILWER